jgi:hypothetical protein
MHGLEMIDMGEKKVQVIKPSATLIHKLHTQGTDISDK